MQTAIDCSQPAPRCAPPDTVGGAFAAARAATLFLDDLRRLDLVAFIDRFDRSTRCEQIWAGEFSRSDGGMAFAAFDAMGAPLFRRVFSLDDATA